DPDEDRQHRGHRAGGFRCTERQHREDGGHQGRGMYRRWRSETRVVPAAQPSRERHCWSLEREGGPRARHAYEEDGTGRDQSYCARQHRAPDSRGRPDTFGTSGQGLIVVEQAEDPAGQLGPDLPQPHRAPRLEPEQFLVSGHPYLPAPGPELEGGGDPDEVPAPCGQVADQGTPSAEEQAPERMQDRDDDLVWDDPEQRDRKSTRL